MQTSLKLIEVEQGSHEWLAARLGIITASKAGLLLTAGKGDGGIGEGLATHIAGLTAENFTGEPYKHFDGNQFTERGKRLEPIVNNYYIAANHNQGLPVYAAGIFHRDFISNDPNDKYAFTVGASPDRLVGDTGGLEIKTTENEKQVMLFDTDKISKDHIAQVQFCLWVTGREHWDYVSYSEGLPLYVQRLYPDHDMHALFFDKCKAAHYRIKKSMNNILIRSKHNGVSDAVK